MLPIYSPFLYIKSILAGRAKPHRTTRFVILLTTTITTFSLLAQHDHIAIWLSAISMLQAIIVFSLSLKHGMGGWAKTDIACVIMAITGIALWQTTTNPVYGLYFGILADLTGMVPTIIKTYRYPQTEIWSFFALDTIAAGCNLLALTHWSLQGFSYPLYLLGMNGLITILAIRKNGIKA